LECVEKMTSLIKFVMAKNFHLINKLKNDANDDNKVIKKS